MQAAAGPLALSSMRWTGSDAWLQGVMHRRQAPTSSMNAMVGACAEGGVRLSMLELCYTRYETVGSSPRSVPAVLATTSATVQASNANAVNTPITCMHGMT